MKRFIFSTIVFVCIASYSFAARPLITDDYNTVDKGNFEVECGSFASIPSDNLRSTGGASFAIKYGLINNVDFGIDIPYIFSNNYGFNDFTLVSKIKLFSFNELEGFSLKGTLKLANADVSSGLGTGHNNYGLTAILSKKLFDFISHFNLGYTIVGVPSGSSNSNVISYGFAIEKEVYPNASMVFEISGVSINNDKGYLNTQIGSKWQITPFYRVDIGYSVDLDNNSQDISTIGITFEF